MDVAALKLCVQELHLKAAEFERIPDDLQAATLGFHFRIVAAEVDAYAEEKRRAESYLDRPRQPLEP